MSDIDKDHLYGRYQKQEDRRNALSMKMAHKALDIPEDDMHIHANRTGLGALGAIGIAIASALPTAALFGYMALKDNHQPPAPPAPIQKAQEWKIDFWIEDGQMKMKPQEAKP